MDLGLQNKNIIVTGGTRGIGLAAAAACAGRAPRADRRPRRTAR